MSRLKSRPFTVELRVSILMLLAIACMLPRLCKSQSAQKIDSLYEVLKTAREDTNKVKTLNTLSMQLCLSGNSYDAKGYAEEALALARRINFEKGETDVNYTFGRIYATEYNFPESLKWFESSLELAQRINYRKLIANSNGALGTTHFYFGDYREALKYHTRALQLNKEMRSSPKTIIFSYNNVGLDYWNLGQFSDAYKFYTLGLQLGIKTKDSLNISWSHDALGLVYDNEGNYPEALKHFLAALKVNTLLSNYTGLAVNNNNIGEIYRKQNNYEQALTYFNAALDANTHAMDDRQIANSHNSIGMIYRLQGKYREATQSVLTAIDLYDNIDFKYGLAYAYSNMALLKYKQALAGDVQSESVKNLELALQNAQHGIENFEAIGQKEGVAECYITMGLVKMELEKYSEARKFLNDALALAMEFKVKEKIKEGYHAIAKLDSITGNWKEAYHNHKWYTIYSDSLLNDENNERIVQLQMQYGFDRREDSLNLQQAVYESKLNEQVFISQRHRQELLLKENELALANNEKRVQELELDRSRADSKIQQVEIESKGNELVLLNQQGEIQSLKLKRQTMLKNYLIGGIVLISLLSFFVYNNYMIRQRLKLQTLRNKIANDLHDDVGSTLSSISIFSEMAQQQSKDTIPLLNTIHESSRKMLDAMADIVWTINPENDQFEKILMRMRNFAYELLRAKNIEFEFTAEENVERIKLPMEVRKNLYLIFKEATNNMVKYSEASKAQFSITNEKDQVSMLIRDNGKGFDINQPLTGNGIRSMKKRAEEIRGTLIMESMPGQGTSILLKVAI